MGGGKKFGGVQKVGGGRKKGGSKKCEIKGGGSPKKRLELVCKVGGVPPVSADTPKKNEIVL